MRKAFYLDVETTGLSPWKNDIVQLAFIIEINGEVVEEGNFLIAPIDKDNIEKKALEIQHRTLAEVLEFPHAKEVHTKLCDVLGKYVNKFNKSDKYTPIGYNAKFDVDFLNNFFKKCGDRYYGSWFNWRMVDPLALLHILRYQRKLDLADYKLSTVCAHYGIPLISHDALNDIRATRELLSILKKEVLR